MTILTSIALIALFFLIPYLTGNIYCLIFKKRTMGIATTYIAGMVIVYAILFVLQLAIIKFKFSFLNAADCYSILFVVLAILGGFGFVWRLWKQKSITTDIIWSKKAIWIYGLILLQGIFYIVIKNPYFENNALLETTKITMATGTIYEYNAFTGENALAGFPLSNKLMFLPVLYAYICTTFGVNPAILFNFIVPAVTFVSFYLIMYLWLQKLGEEHNMNWQMLLLAFIWIIQTGDAWSHATAFRVLHTGYMGEALFFGILLPYALYMIKNKCYLLSIACMATFPGLIKYDALLDFVKGFGEYKAAAAYASGVMVLYLIALFYYVYIYKKTNIHLLNLNLTICLSFSEIWEKVINSEKDKRKKIVGGVILVVLILLCGNLTIISDATEFRSNIYGVNKAEYELLEIISGDAEKEETVLVLAHDNLNRWICRTDFDIQPLVGYDYADNGVSWYSYEVYDEEAAAMWNSIHKATNDMERELQEYIEKYPIDYVVLERITKELPILENERIKCVLQTPSYLVYSVDKK